MELGLQQKAALVLCGGGGLGGAVARTLAAEGARVCVADIDVGAAEKVAADILESGGTALPLGWDLSDISVISDRLNSVTGALGTIDILVNITGGPPPTRACGTEPAAWQRHFNSMVLSVIAITDGVLPQMRSHGWGRIITSTSSGVVVPIADLAISNSLRLSLVGWSKTLAREVGPYGLTSNIVVPGRISTPRIVSLDEHKARRENRSVEDVSSESAANIPLARYGDPQEYADVVAFLASERASYVTGAMIRVDGGLIQCI